MSKILFAIIASPITIISHGYVISRLWEWFIVPKFGIFSVSLLEAIAVSIVAGAISGYGYKYTIIKTTVYKAYDDADLQEMLMIWFQTIILTALLPLTYGWVLLQIMHLTSL